MKLLLRLVLLCAALAACAHVEDHTIAPADVSEAQVWGKAERVTKLKHLYFSDQPDVEALEQARENGVVAVINLRRPDEMNWDERAAVERLGMKYYNISLITKSAAIESAQVAEIEAAVSAQHHAPVLLHCSSSNRAGAWLSIHLADKHGMDEEQALAVGRRAGMTKKSLEDSVKRYMNVHSRSLY